MKTFTVIGHYYDTGECYSDVVSAETAYKAMQLIAANVDDDNLAIIGAIEGAHSLITPGDDNAKSAFVSDIREIPHD